jgi:hypothetical protein
VDEEEGITGVDCSLNPSQKRKITNEIKRPHE